MTSDTESRMPVSSETHPEFVSDPYQRAAENGEESNLALMRRAEERDSSRMPDGARSFIGRGAKGRGRMDEAGTIWPGHRGTIDKVSRSLARARGLARAFQRGRVPFTGDPMTLARQVVAGRTYLISRRCTQRQFLLRPDAMAKQIYLYCLGEAAHRYDITLHGFIAMSNHQHLQDGSNPGI